MLRMSEKKLIAIDPQTRVKLKALGGLNGSPVIEPEDLNSPKSKQIIKTLPILKDTICGIDNPSARNLELLRQFSQLAQPHVTLWGSARMDDAGQIQSINAPANIELAQALLKNPSRIIAEIDKSLDTYTPKLPREWLDPTLEGGTLVTHFSGMGVELAELDNPGMAAETVGPNLSHFLFDVILILKMLATAQNGKHSERQKARLFLKDLVERSAPFLRLTSKHTQKSSGTFQISVASHCVDYTLFILIERANKMLGRQPLNFSIPSPEAVATAAK